MLKNIFKRIIPIVFCLVILSSCTTNSYNKEYHNVFENVPSELLEPSIPLKKIPHDKIKSSYTVNDIKYVMKTVGENYTISKKNQIKLDALQQWINTQKEIFKK